MKETSLWYLAVPVALVLGALGVFLLTRRAPNDEVCSPAPSILGDPRGVIHQAVNDLLEEGVITNHTDAEDAITGFGWVLDPQDDYRLEFWLSFGEGRNMNTVGFEVICISPDFEPVWKYDGLQVLPGE